MAVDSHNHVYVIAATIMASRA